MIEMDWARWGNVGVSAAVFVTAAVFVVTYHLRAPWRSSAAGWHMMLLAACIGLLGAYTVLVTLWPDGALATVLRVARTVLLLGTAGLMIRQTRMVLAAQRR